MYAADRTFNHIPGPRKAVPPKGGEGKNNNFYLGKQPIDTGKNICMVCGERKREKALSASTRQRPSHPLSIHIPIFTLIYYYKLL